MVDATPDFAALLQSVSERDRRGRVFKLLDVDGTLLKDTRRAVGPLVSAIGKAAGVVVDERLKAGETVRKFASAHDLRRAFGQRWTMRVMPTVLKELMRYTDISTTMKFYVGSNAEAVADAVWATVGNTSGNSHQTVTRNDSKNTSKTNGDDRS